ncbi:MAG: TonB-dependent receptor, partial [Flavobacterium sp.]
NSSDYTEIGHGLPKHTGGFTNNFRYKGFDLNVFFQWSYGNDIMNANRIVFEGNTKNASYLNQFASYADRWTPENPESDLFRTRGYYGGGYASQFVEDGSFLRLKTVSFGYRFDSKQIQSIGLKSVRVYVSAQNLYTWTKYSGPDPEVNTYNSALTSGFDYSAYPRSRTITFGTNITF